MKKGLILLFLFVSLFFYGCSGDDDLVIVGSYVSCNEGYVKFEGECCLDLDDSGLCDEYEKELELKENDSKVEDVVDLKNESELEVVEKEIEVVLPDFVEDPVLGDLNAKVTVVKYSDFGCGFCNRWRLDSFDLLKKEFIDTGKVKFVVKDFPLREERAGVAANCVMKELGSKKYFEMYEKIFDNQKSLFHKNFILWADEVGVDSTKFSACLSNSSMKAEMKADLKEGTLLGVIGTPCFFINGKKICGAQPYRIIYVFHAF